LTIFLHLSPEIAAKRGGYGDERYENLIMQAKVRECFTRIGRDMAGKNWQTIDAGRGVEEVAADCREAASEAVRRVNEKDSPVGRLFT
jgi:dTMP kinase